MKICFVNPTAVLGGGEKSLVDMIKVLSKTKSIEMHVILMDSGPLADNVRNLGCKVHLLELPATAKTLGESDVRFDKPGLLNTLMKFGRQTPGLVTYRKRLQDQITSISPDIIHSNGLKSHLICATLRESNKCIWHVRDFLGERPMAAKVAGPLASRIRGIITNSIAVQRDTRKLFPGCEVKLLYNGIDASVFAPASGEEGRLERLAGIQKHDRHIRVGLVGTFARWKGHDIFLRAIAELVHKQQLAKPATFFIIGGELYKTSASQISKQELVDLAHSLKIVDYVGFVPFQDRPEMAIRDLDILVHASSRPEPFGRTIVEGMAMEKPVIATRAGGVPEIVTHEYNGLLVPAGNPHELANAIQNLLKNTAFATQMGKNGRKTVLAQFDHENLRDNLIKVYAGFGFRDPLV